MLSYLSHKQRNTVKTCHALTSDWSLSDRLIHDVMPELTAKVSRAINRNKNVDAVLEKYMDDVDSLELFTLLTLSALAAKRRCNDSKRAKIDASQSFRRACKSLIDPAIFPEDDFDDYD